MKIAKVEIEVIEMTTEEEHALWEEWKYHYKTKKDVIVCGCVMEKWVCADGNNALILVDADGQQRWLDIKLI